MGHSCAIYYYRNKRALPDISYDLALGMCLIHICIVLKELTTGFFLSLSLFYPLLLQHDTK